MKDEDPVAEIQLGQCEFDEEANVDVDVANGAHIDVAQSTNDGSIEGMEFEYVSIAQNRIQFEIFKTYALLTVCKFLGGS